VAARLRRWKVLGSEAIAVNPWNFLRQDSVELPDGSVLTDYFVSVRPHVAITFPLTPAGDVVLVQQYKHGVERITTEVPAGGFTSGSPTKHAMRELREETGYVADLTPLAVLFDDSTKNTNRVHVYLGRNATKVGDQRLDDVESRSGLHVLLRPVDQILPLIMSGEIRTESSVAACLLALAALASGAHETPGAARQ
jgi:8-oxo-dGTP pyrophosphatase MutT (NUDIX family)